MCSKVLTAEQEEFVWFFICSHMSPDDKNPCEVIKENYGGDRSRYLRAMANWHDIIFCDVCGKANKQDTSVFQANIENTDVNLCSDCAV
ncbi:MAG: hypothetical protein A2998_01820 [Candidatus Staskawiczbacteria bacterium RIFCSPLOWO2_01_FULL_37_25b]|uniref:Uncharacterized protein n=2 Tax=Candidatus Staskawicziibacteriota TaxID=1817916 RepID=A0A1G2HKX5_9BACT|nr:MAG: hypothetical protein A2812_01575 [Candidatus Staskawiczbacteria bacterium RIFCSPHIGHO2_01_FULL_36_16]OGZ74338.1 MAG: hypothetical protein A2998_01820 [Candidatus Staskawiczbacteria bacterium RIFCSPLOWO2_01_FULL_37_25b]